MSEPLLHLPALMGMLPTLVPATSAALTLARLCRDAASRLVDTCSLVPGTSRRLRQIPCAELHCRGAAGRLTSRNSMLYQVRPTVLLPRHFLPALLSQAPPVSCCALLPDVAVQHQLCVLTRAAHYTAQFPPAAVMALELMDSPSPLLGLPHPRPSLLPLLPARLQLHSHLPPPHATLCAGVEGALHELCQLVQADIAATIAGRPHALFIPTLIQVLMIAVGMLLLAKFNYSILIIWARPSLQVCNSMVTLPEDAVVETALLA